MTPFPLDGGRVGDGGARAAVALQDGEGAARDLPHASRPHRHPNPSPIEGEGLIKRARRLRKQMTLPERRLWAELRRSELHFRRQVPIGRYVADFACHARCVVVEVDGAPHRVFAEVALRDIERDAWFTSQGYRVLRFTNAQVMDQVEQVLSSIHAAVLSPPSPTLPPSADGKAE